MKHRSTFIRLLQELLYAGILLTIIPGLVHTLFGSSSEHSLFYDIGFAIVAAFIVRSVLVSLDKDIWLNRKYKTEHAPRDN